MPRVILLIEKSRSYGRGLLRGIARYSRTHGPWLFCEQPEFYRRPAKPLARWIKDTKAEGIIGHIADQKLADLITELGIPAILCGIKTPVSHSYDMKTDSTAIGDLAAEYFLGRGFRHFAYCGLNEFYWSHSRCKVFKTHLAKAGFMLHTCTPRKRNEAQAIVEWLLALPTPIALLACNDDRSKDVLTACGIAGLQVPDDVAILGVDNDDLICTVSHPELSSIALDTEKAGYRAAQLLDRVMSGERLESSHATIQIAPRYVVTRQSTDVMAIQDRRVAAALRFIRDHCRDRIQVDDVANAAGVSRRSLQQRFSQTLGHSIHDEIRRIRIEQMARLLIDTDLSVSQIANLLGYSYIRNISRWFQNEKGMTPSAFRALHRSTSTNYTKI